MFLISAMPPVRAEMPGPESMNVIPFNGSIDLTRSSVELKVGRPQGVRSLELSAFQVAPEAYHFTMGIAHFPVPRVDAVARLEGDIRVHGADRRNRELTGEIHASGMVFNDTPLRDASLRFAVRDKKFVLASLLMGNLVASGDVSLTGGYRCNLNVDLLAFSSDEIESVLRAAKIVKKENQFDFATVLRGNINLNGFFPRPYISGKLAAEAGHLRAFNFDSIRLDFTGNYPVLNVNEAFVTQSQGASFRLSGSVNLADKVGLVSQIQHLQKAPVVAMDENHRSWVFRKLASSEETKTEMKYFFLKDSRGDTEAVLGIQKSIGF